MKHTYFNTDHKWKPLSALLPSAGDSFSDDYVEIIDSNANIVLVCPLFNRSGTHVLGFHLADNKEIENPGTIIAWRGPRYQNYCSWQEILDHCLSEYEKEKEARQ